MATGKVLTVRRAVLALAVVVALGGLAVGLLMKMTWLVFVAIGGLLCLVMVTSIAESNRLSRSINQSSVRNSRAEAKVNTNLARVASKVDIVNGRFAEIDANLAALTGSLAPARPQARREASELGAVSYWARALKSDPKSLDWFVGIAQHDRLLGARDVLAVASTGRLTWSDLELLLETYRIDALRERAVDALRGSTWKQGLLALSRVLYSQQLSQFDRLNALTVYRLAQDLFGIDAITHGVDRSYYSDLLLWDGKPHESTKVLEYTERNSMRAYSQQFLLLNAINPWINNAPADEHVWVNRLNRILQDAGLVGISLAHGEAPPFFRLSAEAPPALDSSRALVTVVMPVFEPDGATDLAIKSILDQSWGNLELIIVDDASPHTDKLGNPTGYMERLKYWEAADPRVRLIEQERNRGAYAARNLGYDLARGEFITVADKDDWHHPQKLEIQVLRLIENPSERANMTNWVRVDDDLRFLLRWGPDRVIHPSFASIMYRTEEIRRDLGYWDTVRKSADGEFKFRFQNKYGIDLQPFMRVPLAFSYMGSDNLTAQDLGLGFEEDDRKTYRRSWQNWHRSIEPSGSYYLPNDPQPRPFAAPAGFLPDREQAPELDKFLDVVFLSEFGFEAGNRTVLHTEITTAAEAGLGVGIMPIQNGLIRTASQRQFAEGMEALVFDGLAEKVGFRDHVKVGTLIVRWPASMQLERRGRSNVHPERVIVVANHMPYETADNRRSYDVVTVTKNIEEMFGVTPVWYAESERIRPFIAPLLPRELISDDTWKGTISVREPKDVNLIDFSRRPVIGRHGRDHVGKWPSSRARFRNVYPVDGSVDVAILGGCTYPIKQGFLSQGERKSWTVFQFGEVPVDEYLGTLDFFVYFHDSDVVEAFGMAVLEAMEKGVVCILPEQFEAVFGDAAVYSSESRVLDTIFQLWNAEAYRAQQRKATAFVNRECSPSAFLGRLNLLANGAAGV